MICKLEHQGFGGRPKENQLNVKITRAVFGNEARKMLTIPDLIDDYNHYMNGVDLTNQSIANTHLKGVRNWLPFVLLACGHSKS